MGKPKHILQRSRPVQLRAVARRLAMVLPLALAGCFGGDGPRTPAAVVTAPEPGRSALATLGTGDVKIAMLLPFSAGGSASGLAQSFQNAAELALAEAGQSSVTISIYDTAGDTDVARVASQSALQDGARLVLGPVFSPAVSGAGDVLRAASVPTIAFSTDASVSGRGVYLLSFLPRQDASRIVTYAAENGVSAFGALLPDDGYGLVMEAAFREAVASAGGRVVTVQKYQPGGISAAVDGSLAATPVDALFVPQGGDDPAAAADALSRAGLSPRLLGSGQWDNDAVLASPALVGAWYPGPQEGGFDGFARRYEARYAAAPPRTASLVYDAVLLANGLAGARGPNAFNEASLQAGDGFIGVDGIFRLTGSGLSERGLAVYEVSAPGESRVVSPAPSAFPRSF